MISMGNTVEISKVDRRVIEPLMEGLRQAAKVSGVIVPGGEIAEMSGLVSNVLWGSTAIGIVHKDKVITGNKIKSGDSIIGIASQGLRSNGCTLSRHILKETYGDHALKEIFEGKEWGEHILTPSLIFAPCIMNIIGTYENPLEHAVKGIAHVTGGGIANNLHRILKKNNFGAELNNLLTPHDFMLELQKLGKVEDTEAYNTWNMGTGMLIITDDPDTVLAKVPQEYTAQIIGNVTDKSIDISLISAGAMQSGEKLTWKF